jgi:hypothetical protein
MLAAPAPAASERADAESLIARLEMFYGSGVAASKVYVGSEFCLACHPAQEGWRSSLHATGLKMVPDDRFSLSVRNGIIYDQNKNGVDDFKDGLDFNQISSPFDKFKPNAPILKYDPAKGYIMTIGLVDFPVVFAHGGSGIYKQRVVVRIPVTDRSDGLSAGVYEGPIQLNETTNQWVLYNTQFWYNADNTPKITPSATAKDAAASNSFHKKCAGCHATTVTVWHDENGEYLSAAPPAILYAEDDMHYLDLNFDGIREQYNTGCERCHGPGGEHIMSRGDPTKIINPKTDLTAKQANELCGGCHSRGASLPNGVHEFPYDETNHVDYGTVIGEELYGGKYWSDKPGLWPDQFESKQHHQQLQDFKRSSKWEFQFHKVTCFECHDVHNTKTAHIREVLDVDATDGTPLHIPAKVEDNSLCLGCHAGFGPFAQLSRDEIVDIKANEAKISAVVESHSRHSYAPDRTLGLSRCTECHMAKVAASGAPYDISTHTFSAIPPAKTLDTQAQGGMPNSCAVRCHRPLAPIFGLPPDADLTKWNESSDVDLANWLQTYYGPQGAWWQTSAAQPSLLSRTAGRSAWGRVNSNR